MFDARAGGSGTNGHWSNVGGHILRRRQHWIGDISTRHCIKLNYLAEQHSNGFVSSLVSSKVAEEYSGGRIIVVSGGGEVAF